MRSLKHPLAWASRRIRNDRRYFSIAWKPSQSDTRGAPHTFAGRAEPIATTAHGVQGNSPLPVARTRTTRNTTRTPKVSQMKVAVILQVRLFLVLNCAQSSPLNPVNCLAGDSGIWVNNIVMTTPPPPSPHIYAASGSSVSLTNSTRCGINGTRFKAERSATYPQL